MPMIPKQFSRCNTCERRRCGDSIKNSLPLKSLKAYCKLALTIERHTLSWMLGRRICLEQEAPADSSSLGHWLFLLGRNLFLRQTEGAAMVADQDQYDRL